MQRSERDRLAAVLASLDMNERNRIYKKAAKLRKADRPKGGARRRRRRDPDHWDDEDTRPARTRGAKSLLEYAVQILAEEEATSDAVPPSAAGGGTRSGLVVETGPGRCTVLSGGTPIDCRLDAALRTKQQSEIAVGDRVLVRGDGDAATAFRVLPRTSSLARPDPHNPHKERVLVANIDAVAVVVAVKQPPLRTAMIDRFLVAVQRGDAEPIVVANKIDLCRNAAERDAELAKLAPYRRQGIPVVVCSASTGEGIDAVRAALNGKLCAFVGKSGTGKSSVLNALAPELSLRTSAVRDADGKGRHTTTAARLFDLPGGARVIDTPGIRALGLGRVDADELHSAFPELEPFRAACRYRDCTHVHEPQCGVREAAGDGRLAAERFRAYLRILEGG